ncbi:deaminase [Arthrobacter sp. ERGS1:01]|uniref:dihydrofolate reductase family protein n=1 Tax=Arthrobacter sp. ERGS1:01 TaxID=1704044 RepID=UPI0006B69828|nr:dihydrofolate reductase family protein [Arthrobacter sp. ERGS1:01]ALE07370.1 deaminase [Arthrobacter sp. ERGS1:01]
MAKLIYIVNTSLDGYMADEDGRIDWTSPSEEVFRFITDLVRPVGTYLYGRRLYEAMAVWETLDAPPDFPQELDFAQLWRGADKVVYSTTLAAAATPRTRIERTFDPAAVRLMKEATGPDLTVGGAQLAGQAIAAGLVDEIHLVVTPHLLGGGAPALPAHVRRGLQLLDQHTFANGTVYVRYGML